MTQLASDSPGVTLRGFPGQIGNKTTAHTCQRHVSNEGCILSAVSKARRVCVCWSGFASSEEATPAIETRSCHSAARSADWYAICSVFGLSSRYPYLADLSADILHLCNGIAEQNPDGAFEAIVLPSPHVQYHNPEYDRIGND